MLKLITKLFTKKQIKMKEGVVKFYNNAKGYGFIAYEGKEIFVHATALKGADLRKDDHVRFEIEAGKKGDNAVNVERI